MSANTVTVTLQAIDRISPVVNGVVGKLAGVAGTAGLIGVGMAVGGAAVSGFVSHLQDASEQQLNLITLAGQFGALTGGTYASGTKLIGDLNDGFATMAAALPGATQDYKDLGLSISDTLIKVNTVGGVFKEQDFKKQVMGITESMGVLQSSTKGLTTADMSRFFTKFVEGASESKLEILKLNMQMPGLLSMLNRETQKLKGKSAEFKDLTTKERATVAQAALKALVPPEVIRDLQGTAASQIEEVKTKIFDQQKGILGFLRDTNTRVKGDQSVMAAMGPLTQSVLGPSGVLATMGKSMKTALKLPSIDPMAALVGGLNGLTGMFKGLANNLKGGIGNAVQKMVSGLLNSINGSLGGAMKSGSGFKIGATIGKVINGLSAAIVGAFKGINIGTIASIIGRAFAVGAQIIGGLLMSINWVQLAQAIVIGIVAAFAGMAASAAAAMAAGVATAIAAINVQIGLAVMSFSQLAMVVGAVAAGVTTLVAGLISAADNALHGALSAGVAALAGLAGAIGSAVANFASGLASAVSSALSSIKMPSFGGGGGGGGGGRKAAGHGLSSLMSMANAESNLSPAGSRPVIANSSELILTKGQQTGLAQVIASARQGTGGGSKVLNFNPTFNVSGATDPATLADRVMSELEARFTVFQASSMA